MYVSASERECERVCGNLNFWMTEQLFVIQFVLADIHSHHTNASAKNKMWLKNQRNAQTIRQHSNPHMRHSHSQNLMGVLATAQMFNSSVPTQFARFSFYEVDAKNVKLSTLFFEFVNLFYIFFFSEFDANILNALRENRFAFTRFMATSLYNSSSQNAL